MILKKHHGYTYHEFQPQLRSFAGKHGKTMWEAYETLAMKEFFGPNPYNPESHLVPKKNIDCGWHDLPKHAPDCPTCQSAFMGIPHKAPIKLVHKESLWLKEITVDPWDLPSPATKGSFVPGAKKASEIPEGFVKVEVKEGRQIVLRAKKGTTVLIDPTTTDFTIV